MGEGNTWYIKYMELKKYEMSPAEKKILLTVIDEENSARREIFIRSILISSGKEPQSGEIETMGRAFAEEQRGLAVSGEWVQENSGKWERKR